MDNGAVHIGDLGVGNPRLANCGIADINSLYAASPPGGHQADGGLS
jgi:hypothetical protein